MDSANPQCASGRTVKIRFRGKPELDQLVTVPVTRQQLEAQLLANWEASKAPLMDYLQWAQTSIIGDKILKGDNTITAEDVSVAACVAWLQKFKLTN